MLNNKKHHRLTKVYGVFLLLHKDIRDRMSTAHAAAALKNGLIGFSNAGYLLKTGITREKGDTGIKKL